MLQQCMHEFFGGCDLAMKEADDDFHRHVLHTIQARLGVPRGVHQLAAQVGIQWNCVRYPPARDIGHGYR
jgi:hypothetical protein